MAGRLFRSRNGLTVVFASICEICGISGWLVKYMAWLLWSRFAGCLCDLSFSKCWPVWHHLRAREISGNLCDLTCVVPKICLCGLTCVVQKIRLCGLTCVVPKICLCGLTCVVPKICLCGLTYVVRNICLCGLT